MPSKQSNKHLKKYKKIDLSCTHFNYGEKHPKGIARKGWLKETTPFKHWEDHPSDNIGLLHQHSGTCSYDFDYLDRCTDDTAKQIMKAGIRFTSEKDNRMKVLFRASKHQLEKMNNFKLYDKPTGAHIGEFIVRMDVVPPSVVIDSKTGKKYTYKWIDKLPKNYLDIPELPKNVANRFMKVCSTEAKVIPIYASVYNEWATEQGITIPEEIDNTGQYTDLGGNKYKRNDSTKRQAIINGIYGWFNFSDAEGKGLFRQGCFDLFDCLVVNKYDGDYEAARKAVCNGTISSVLKTRIDKLNQPNFDGIKYDLNNNNNMPYLSMDILMPRDDKGRLNGFGKLVKSITYYQEGVYNPDMAFWYSLCFADYLISTSYNPPMTNACEPIYSFTSGPTSSGKTVTINSGDMHLSHMTYMSPKDKQCVKNVGSPQGLEDLVTIDMNDGCDILFTQDEYGLKENGTMDKASREMRSMILDWKTLSRASSVTPRLLAKTGDKKKGAESKQCVHFNYFTTGTNETLKGVLGDSEVGQGYIQRFVGGASRTPHFNTRFNVFGSISHQGFKTKEKLMASLKIIFNKKVTFKKPFGKDYTQVTITEDARLYINELGNKNILDPDSARSKTAANIQPIAKLAAIFEDPDSPQITIAMVKWAHTIVECSVQYFKWLIDELAEQKKTPAVEIRKKLTSYMKSKCLGKKNQKMWNQIRGGSVVGSISDKPTEPKAVFDGMIADGLVTSVSPPETGGHVMYYFNKDVSE